MSEWYDPGVEDSPEAPQPQGPQGLTALLKRLTSGDDNSTLVQMARYLVVAMIAFAVDFGALFVFTHYAGIHYLISNALGFVLGVVTNYGLSVRWVFSHRAVADWRAEATIFTVIGLAGLGFNEVIIWFVTEVLGVHYLVSKLISTGMVFFFNFFLRKFFLFNKK